MCKESQRLMATKKFDSLQSAALYGPLKYSLHPALISKKSELIYLRCVTEALMPFLLPGPEVKSK